MLGFLVLLLLALVVLVLVFVVRVTELSETVRKLQAKTEELSRELRQITAQSQQETHHLFTTSTGAAHSLGESTRPSEEPPLSERLALEMTAIEEQARTARATPPPPPQPPPARPLPPPEPSRTREEWEALIGGKLLNRIGALALIVGVGFFLKYAFDNNWLSETVRVLIGGGTGIFLLVGAARLHARQLEIVAQGLVGAGIAILYLSVYASFNFYHLVSQPIAFVLMAGVTVLAFTRAFRYDSLAVSLLGWAGGFLTPVMLSSGRANELGLFTYTFLLDAGLLLITLRKPQWIVLQPLAFLGTVALSIAWYVNDYSATDLTLTAIVLAFLWALFFLTGLAFDLRGTHPKPALGLALTALNAILVHLGLYSLLSPEYHGFMSPLTSLQAATYGAAAIAVRRARPEQIRMWSWYALLAALLLIIATGAQLDDKWLLTGWSVEAVLILWAALRFNVAFLRGGVLILQAVLLQFLLMYAFQNLSPYQAYRTAGFLTYAASLVSCGYLLQRRTDRWAVLVRALYSYAWPCVLFVLLTVETNDVFVRLMAGSDHMQALDFQRWLLIALVWGLYGGALSWLAIRENSVPLLRIGVGSLLLGLLLGGIRGVAFVPVHEFTPVLNLRAAILLINSATGIMAYLRLRRTSLDPDLFFLIDVKGITSILLFLVLLTGETRDYFEHAIVLIADTSSVNEVQRLTNLEQLSLSGVWLAFSIVVMILGIWRRSRGIRVLAIVLFGLTILKIFLYDLSFLETLYRIFSFIGLGIILLVVSYLYQRYRNIIVGDEGEKA